MTPLTAVTATSVVSDPARCRIHSSGFGRFPAAGFQATREDPTRRRRSSTVGRRGWTPSYRGQPPLTRRPTARGRQGKVVKSQAWGWAIEQGTEVRLGLGRP